MTYPRELSTNQEKGTWKVCLFVLLTLKHGNIKCKNPQQSEPQPGSTLLCYPSSALLDLFFAKHWKTFSAKLALFKCTETKEKGGGGNSLAVQGLGLCALTAKVPGSIPGQGTKFPQATQRGQK